VWAVDGGDWGGWGGGVSGHGGGMVGAADADQVIADGQIDMVGMTRALSADPDLPNKVRQGHADDVRTCVGANEGCIDRIYQGKPVTCIQNPATGRELEMGEPQRAAAPRRVLIVGAGVAGLEAARVASL